MASKGTIAPLRSSFDAYEHCRVEMEAWHPRWQTALKSDNIDELRALAERFRNRVLAVFPRDRYGGSRAGALANFGYRLSELSEYEHALAFMKEARSCYEEALPVLASGQSQMQDGIHQHCYAEVLLRFGEVSGDISALEAAKALCEALVAREDFEMPRRLSTLGAILRRLAEHRHTVAACDEALVVIRQADVDQTSETGDLSWAQQRRSQAAVLLLKHRLAQHTDLSAALKAAEEVVSNYTINPHKFWIRPSARADATALKAEIEKLSAEAQP